MRGPLAGLKVIEFAGIGPAPFAVMLLSDLGADVVRIDRPGQGRPANDVTGRGRTSIELDLKIPSARTICWSAIDKADVLVEGYRPGVMERLRLGPAEVAARNPRLVYGRMTGWGQTGPLAGAAGHDINYIALTGALDAIGKGGGPPIPPLNLVGDFGGGALYLVLGIVSALFEREKSGLGQVIDAAIVDGVSSLLALFHWFTAVNPNSMLRGRNFLGGEAHFYGCYECADGAFISIGAIEPQFYSLLLEKLGLAIPMVGELFDPARWPEDRARIADAFRKRTRAQWCELLEGTDVCFAPVLSMAEAPAHPHMRDRGTLVSQYGLLQPGVAPRFSRTPGAIQSAPPAAGEGGAEALRRWGVSHA
jgi:alpha-methylacyl-CoA racemase